MATKLMHTWVNTFARLVDLETEEQLHVIHTWDRSQKTTLW